MGNKTDLNPEERVVDYTEAQKAAEERNCVFLEASARDNMNVNNIFSEVLVKDFGLSEKNGNKTDNERRVSMRRMSMRRLSGGLFKRNSSGSLKSDCEQNAYDNGKCTIL